MRDRDPFKMRRKKYVQCSSILTPLYARPVGKAFQLSTVGIIQFLSYRVNRQECQMLKGDGGAVESVKDFSVVKSLEERRVNM